MVRPAENAGETHTVEMPLETTDYESGMRPGDRADGTVGGGSAERRREV